MRQPSVDRDPGDEHPTLFPDPPRCTAPGCEAGDRKNLCRHDYRVSEGAEYVKRPRGCLITGQLAADEELPF